VCSRGACGRSFPLRERHRPLQRAALGVQVGGNELQHVKRRGPDGAGAGERRYVPVAHNLPLRVVPQSQVLFHPRRERDRRVRHAERLPNTLALEILV